MAIRSPLLKVFNYVLLGLFLILIYTPILTILIVSLKTNEEYAVTGLLEWPRHFEFQNYLEAVKRGNMVLGLQNTIVLIVVSLIGSVLMGTTISYALARFDYKFSKFLLGLFLLAAIIPMITTQVAVFTLIRDLGLYNTLYAGMVIYLSTNVLHIYIFLQFIYKIPRELDESAMIDGAGHFGVYWRIILPQLKPAIVTIGILKILDVYNDMFIPYLYMPKATLKTVTTALMAFSYDQNSQWNLMSAGIIAVMVPSLILYFMAQRYIISGLTDGAVKS